MAPVGCRKVVKGKGKAGGTVYCTPKDSLRANKGHARDILNIHDKDNVLRTIGLSILIKGVLNWASLGRLSMSDCRKSQLMMRLSFSVADDDGDSDSKILGSILLHLMGVCSAQGTSTCILAYLEIQCNCAIKMYGPSRETTTTSP